MFRPTRCFKSRPRSAHSSSQRPSSSSASAPPPTQSQSYRRPAAASPPPPPQRTFSSSAAPQSTTPMSGCHIRLATTTALTSSLIPTSLAESVHMRSAAVTLARGVGGGCFSLEDQ
ncbi:uncharacterized protein EV422DRAFT_568236 [Fimicolochytrium jonesii]|uniref:uncharacterized protein n=1 Tax=Fimicolochytrium jonesii TaxID=1396493 RepID=UPI0022FEC430|nr:uncharacterized protein EV422DRAFT_568236 [Fimicolochytrium jonesii]KAI8820271.1 hypothetical protein EV422DRAFT_568236 [Fimicolochytrium jonesii]